MAATVRWRIPPGSLPVHGRVAVAPAALGALVTNGTLTEVVVEPSAVVTTLAGGRTWRDDGPRVRAALQDALAKPDGWTAAPGEVPEDPDGSLRAAAEDVLAGPFGAWVRGHGGAVTVVGVERGVVTVALTGACRGCPAAALTLHLRFERELRVCCPELVGVRAVSGDASGDASGDGQRASRWSLTRSAKVVA